MNTVSIIQGIDAEIFRLEQVRAILSGVSTFAAKRRSGRPAGSLAATPKRKLSPEARARIVAAQKRRWAAVRRAAK